VYFLWQKKKGKAWNLDALSKRIKVNYKSRWYTFLRSIFYAKKRSCFFFFGVIVIHCVSTHPVFDKWVSKLGRCFFFSFFFFNLIHLETWKLMHRH
jgi:hypothetical protein